ncbi:MAG: chloride channel protein [Cyclobacteriaceae bacterium]|nr:chloride channel protein [Cyclobacteriaceae bacterium HetDA_MAG_MS6]
MSFRKLLMRFLVWRLKHISDNNFSLIIAGIVGLFAGLAAVTLKTSVHAIQNLLQRNLDITGVNYLYLGYPLIGILLTVVVAQYITREGLGHGITQILYSISRNSSIIRRTKMYSRMVTSAITVGFGGSVGLEAPIVVTGSAIGSNLARLVHLDYKKRTLLIGCGSAGAVSAIFNSPIAGVIFAIEVILTDVTINKFIPILLASVCGQLVALVLLGEDILFSFKLVDGFAATDTPYYIILGIICGGASLYFTRLMYRIEGNISRLKNKYGKAFIGGISLAIIVLIFPPIYGEGYDTIKLLLSGQSEAVFERSFFYYFADSELALIAFLTLIILAKPVASALTIGSGGSGGIFAPSLFMGGLTGFVLALTLNIIFPEASISLRNFTLVGMCGVMSGVLHAPLTAIFLIAEITSGYVLFVPLMLVSAISFTTISYFEKHSLYTKKLIETGDLIPYDKDRIVLSLIELNKIVEKDLLTIKPDETLEDLVHVVQKSKRNIFPVVNEEGALEGIVTLDMIREIMFDQNNRENVVIRAIMQKPPAEVAPREKMQSVMNKFEVTQAWNLPVIDDGKYIGFISKSRIFNAYRKKLIRQTKE